MRPLPLLGPVVVTAALVGCYTGSHVGMTEPTPTQDTSPTSVATSDLPCDVAKLLGDNCVSCHGTTPSGGAHNSMVSAADLAKPSKKNPSLTVAEEAVLRMKDASDPMPPDGLLPASDAAVLEAWVAAGMPSGTCGVEGGSDTATPTVCTSNSFWTGGNRESPRMNPGQACITCHKQEGEGPRTGFLGTVYPTAHEPDDCNGVNGTVTATQVVITDATGATFTGAVNAAGNFVIQRSFTAPYTAKVVSGSKTRAMKTPQTSGDCNSCHTEKGTKDAPGRIYAP